MSLSPYKPQRSKYNRVQRDYRYPDKPKELQWREIVTPRGRKMLVPADRKAS